MTRNLTLILLFFTNVIFGQTYYKKYFEKTSWFSNNKDSNFFKSDTLRIIKHSNFGPKWSPKEYAESEMKYLNHGDFVEFGFGRHNIVNLSYQYHNYMNEVPGGQWSWTFDKKTNLLTIYDGENKLFFSFRPISERQIKIESRFSEQKDLLTTTELTVIRKK
jgi:hypothetical protein